MRAGGLPAFLRVQVLEPKCKRHRRTLDSASPKETTRFSSLMLRATGVAVNVARDVSFADVSCSLSPRQTATTHHSQPLTSPNRNYPSVRTHAHIRAHTRTNTHKRAQTRTNTHAQLCFGMSIGTEELVPVGPGHACLRTETGLCSLLSALCSPLCSRIHSLLSTPVSALGSTLLSALLSALCSLLHSGLWALGSGLWALGCGLG